MRFRNAFQLLFENFKNVYKVLFYKIVVAVICVALYSALILPELNEIFSSAQWQTLLNNINEFFTAFFPGHESNFDAVRDQIVNSSLPAFGTLVWSKATAIFWRTMGCLLVYLLQRFADTMCYFTVGGMLNDRMVTYGETPFKSAYVANLGKSTKYSLVYVPVAFLFDLAIVILCGLMFAFFNIFLALFLCVTLLAVGQALKLTVTSAWMPAMTADNLPISKAMRCMTKQDRKQALKLFMTYLGIVYLIIVVNVIAFLFTFASALLITIPASYFLLVCVQYVNYFTVKGKKYFITYQSIESNECRGDTEHFFHYVDETAETQEPAAQENQEKTE
ncbi:MAG: hypothetical protein IJX98_03320 [Clostridia bacterium]|nr:hypothetical protein [Clostridia bacterium]